MNRRSFVKMMGIAGAGCVAGAGCNVSGSSHLLTSEAGTLLNFILITADDLNYDSVGCYGCECRLGIWSWVHGLRIRNNFHYAVVRAGNGWDCGYDKG